MQRHHPAKSTGPGQPAASRLRGIVQSRMWKWIFDAHRLLGLTVEVVDDRLSALTPSSAGKPLARPDTEPDGRDPVPQAIAQSLATAMPVLADAAERRVSATPIMAGAGAVGAIVLSARSGRFEEKELTRAGSLLANAIQDQLVAAAAGAERQLAEDIRAVSVAARRDCARLRARSAAHVCGGAEHLGRDRSARLPRRSQRALHARSSLPGSDSELNPPTFDAELPREGNGLRRLSQLDRRELGFGGPGETALVHLSTDGGPWLIAMNSATDPAARDRSVLYVAALGHALNAAVGRRSLEAHMGRDAALRG